MNLDWVCLKQTCRETWSQGLWSFCNISLIHQNSGLRVEGSSYTRRPEVLGKCVWDLYIKPRGQEAPVLVSPDAWAQWSSIVCQELFVSPKLESLFLKGRLPSTYWPSTLCQAQRETLLLSSYRWGKSLSTSEWLSSLPKDTQLW